MQIMGQFQRVGSNQWHAACWLLTEAWVPEGFRLGLIMSFVSFILALLDVWKSLI